MRTWIREFLSNDHLVTVRKNWLWAAIGAAGMVIHAGTAALRLSTFFPSPRLLDFSGFYASAWAVRLGMSPYNLPTDWLRSLQITQAIPFTPPPIYNPPFWPWLLQPLTWLKFAPAVWVWLAFNLVLLLGSSIALANIAGYRSWWVRLALFLVVLTFGPVFLDLTLGQTSVLLLATALVIGRSLSSDHRTAPVLAAASAALGVGSKLFPLVWVGAWAFMRHWREFVLAVLLLVIIFGAGFASSPGSSREYWAYLFRERLATSSETTSVDDQALIAWLDRLVRPQAFDVSGFGVEQRTTVVWSPSWSVDARAVRWIGYVVLGLLLLPCLFLLWRSSQKTQEAIFYLWVLYGLIALLHIERYNHVLLLPAMAWLWGRGKWQRSVVVVAYALVGLSRLTHLWAMILPAPWGPLSSGFGMYAVFALGGAIAICVWPSSTRSVTSLTAAHV